VVASTGNSIIKGNKHSKSILTEIEFPTDSLLGFEGTELSNGIESLTPITIDDGCKPKNTPEPEPIPE